MDLRRIRYFLALARTLDFSRAARGLGITQPALTKAMNRLETETGGRLIRREGRRTHLTPLGEAMLERFAELDRVAHEAEEAARRLVDGVGARLRIGIAATVGPARLVGLVERFLASHPRTGVSLHGIDGGRALEEALLHGRLDCAFDAASGGDEPRLRRIRLYDEPLVLVLPRGAGESAGRPRIGRLAGDAPASTGPDAPAPLSSGRDDWTEALVAAGLGTGLVPRDSVGARDVEVRPAEPGSPRRTISLAVPSGREDHAAIRGLVELARRFAEDARAAEPIDRAGLARGD